MILACSYCLAERRPRQILRPTARKLGIHQLVNELGQLLVAGQPRQGVCPPRLLFSLDVVCGDVAPPLLLALIIYSAPLWLAYLPCNEHRKTATCCQRRVRLVVRQGNDGKNTPPRGYSGHGSVDSEEVASR